MQGAASDLRARLGYRALKRQPLLTLFLPDKRTAAWLKLKKDYVTGVGDSLDLVPIGAWHGNGRKADWWSPILLAVYDHHRGIFVALCKCMSGTSSFLPFAGDPP
jgi:DNA ligase-1